MNLPIIDLSMLPDLDHLVGLFGTFADGPGFDDSIIILATYVYETSGFFG